jgi:AcrR family transcriptional regulator
VGRQTRRDDGGAATPGADRREPLSRERITAVALDLLNEQGLQGFTMRALGQRLGVEAMAVYHYFPSKEALLEAVSQEARDVNAFFGDFYAEMEASGTPPAERVVKLGLRYIEFSRLHPAQFHLLFNSAPIEYDTWQEFVDAPTTFRLPQGVVQSGIDTGEFHPRPGYGRDEMAFHLWVLIHGLSVLRQTSLRAMEVPLDRLERTLLEVLVESFRSGGGA